MRTVLLHVNFSLSSSERFSVREVEKETGLSKAVLIAMINSANEP